MTWNSSFEVLRKVLKHWPNWGGNYPSYGTDGTASRPLDIAVALTTMTPERRSGWFRRAFSLGRLNRTAEAKDALVLVVDEFEANSTFPYYLACYCAQLGQPGEAKGWFALALANAASDEERERVKSRAQADPDMEPIRSSLKEL